MNKISYYGGNKMPLMLAPTQSNLKVVSIVTDEKTKKRLESMGIFVGSEVVLYLSAGGNVVCRVKDGKIALDRVLSSKIFVTPC